MTPVPLEPHNQAKKTKRHCLVVLRNSRHQLSGKIGDNETIRRYVLQAQARELVPQMRVSNCLRLHLPHATQIDVIANGERANFTNLTICASVWTCPICQSRITEQRRNELALAIEFWLSNPKHKLFMATYTFSHTLDQTLNQTLDILKQAKRVFKSGKRWQSIIKKYGIVGTITANEVTFGSNGYHPHQHELIFIDTTEIKRTFSTLTLEGDLSSLWINALNSLGAIGLEGIACDVVSSQKKIAEYVQKFGQEESIVKKWSLSHEMTKVPSKRKTKNKDSFTMMQLLELAFFGVTVAGELWTEYAYATKGKQQLIWSRGLKELLNVTELSDTQLASNEPDDMRILGSISLWDWRAIIQGGDKQGKRGKILEQAKLGKQALADYLRKEFSIELMSYDD